MVLVPFSHFVRAENTSVSIQAIELRGSAVNPPDGALSDAATRRLYALCNHSQSVFSNVLFAALSGNGSERDSSGAGDVSLLTLDLFDWTPNSGEAGV
jgi:hypothetical protein